MKNVKIIKVCEKSEIKNVYIKNYYQYIKLKSILRNRK